MIFRKKEVSCTNLMNANHYYTLIFLKTPIKLNISHFCKSVITRAKAMKELIFIFLLSTGSLSKYIKGVLIQSIFCFHPKPTKNQSKFLPRSTKPVNL